MEQISKPKPLKKVLGLAFGIAVVIGGTIGVGILRTPGIIAGFIPNAPLIILCWILIGLYILLSASSYAELTTMLPKAGGAYNYIKRAFGNYAGFINGWFDFICNVLGPAYFSIVLSEYSLLLFPGHDEYQKIVAIGFLTLFTSLHLPGVKSGSVSQQITSAVKIILFLILIVGCFASGRLENLTNIPATLVEGGLIIGIFRSLQLIIGSYDGWMSASFFAEENNNPDKNIPRAYLIGAITVGTLYILINAAIFYVLPVEQVANAPLAVSDAATVAFGKWSSNFIIMIALFSLASILNAYMMIPSRILFGLSRDGFFVKQGSMVNKGGTPYFSLICCYIISLFLIIFSTFDQLFALGAFMMTIVTGFAFASLVRLRKKEPLLPRPYKAWGYPYSTYLLILITIILFIGFSIGDPHSLLIVIAIMVISYPFFRIISRRNK